MRAGVWAPRIGGHQPLLQPEDEVLGRPDRRGEHGIRPAGAQLQRPQRAPERVWQLAVAVEPQQLDLRQQVVGGAEQVAPPPFGGTGVEVAKREHGRTLGPPVRSVNLPFTSCVSGQRLNRRD